MPRIFGMILIKWAIIYIITRAARKAVENHAH